LSYINLNGKIIEASAAGLPVDNRAFRYGHGLFETMLVQDGTLQLADYHWERLMGSAAKLYFRMPKLLTPTVLEEEVLKTVRKNGLEQLCRVRLQVYAGTGGLLEEGDSHAGYVIECFPLDEQILQLNEAGLVMGIADGLQKANDALANHKTSNALVYAIAARQAKENKWNDALVRNTAGNIIESTIANIFWIKDSQVFTPPLTEGCIAGVMRKHIMTKIKVVEQVLTQAMLDDADAVFLSNAIRRIKWVRAIGNKEYSPQVVQTLYKDIFR